MGRSCGLKPLRQLRATMLRKAQTFCPFAACPGRRNVFGKPPLPQSLNEPKSLYHDPSGTFGFDSSQIRSLLRSSSLILRSRIRSIRWSRMAAGMLGQVATWGIIHRKGIAPALLRESSLVWGRAPRGTVRPVQKKPFPSASGLRCPLR